MADIDFRDVHGIQVITMSVAKLGRSIQRELPG